MMKQYILIGILGVGLHFGFAQKHLKEFYVNIDDDKQSYIHKSEVSIDEYCFFLYMIGEKHGEDTELYKSLIPDTAKFREWYGFSFSFLSTSSQQTVILQRSLPMVAISYEQALSYCQWVEERMNKFSQSYTYQCALPEKADYEKVLKKAKITDNDFLSPLQVQYKEKKRKRKNEEMTIIRPYMGNPLYGITDNVAEYTQDGMIVGGGASNELKFMEKADKTIPIGFRIKTTKVSKK
ncbi:MAG TPA: SUMF1/EgtB/PvdO family nonheme iron enzyme [Bacteroidales bacterium]|nr:SUMF1/EgtB/PvdO family nonheme iron enzyme [Bacteroidales bacterium]HOR82529.1 SUMF1/EgtB/PvdO family nonheme iron enzyme [Bacteroidales bacterium]HPJ91263.1 SUMF1/EgtB/PvdO family nonheme iron enzyme [Bacteroidales bacterium]